MFRKENKFYLYLKTSASKSDLVFDDIFKILKF